MREERKVILVAHAKRYPPMQPHDAVKLIYQNEFGGGNESGMSKRVFRSLLRDK